MHVGSVSCRLRRVSGLFRDDPFPAVRRVGVHGVHFRVQPLGGDPAIKARETLGLIVEERWYDLPRLCCDNLAPAGREG